MTIAARKRAELDAKCAAFDEELDRWAAALEDFPQHTSQIQRLDPLFRRIGRGLRKRIQEMPDGDLVTNAFERSAEVLVLYRAWAFYRQKLDQRFVPRQREFLEIADELAYRWWKPAYDTLIDATAPAKRREVAKAPPLVFLNGDASPFTLTRKVGFQVEEANGLDPEAVEWSRRLLRRAPVPVIGLPYFAARHVPDLLVIAHEVGHNVQDDFGLAASLEAAVRAALPQTKASDDRAAPWLAWLDEIFADLWGVLSAGAGFVDALFDLVAANRTTIETEWRATPEWGEYPTAALRLRLAMAALRALGLKDEAAAREAALNSLCRTHAMTELDPDVDPLVRALLDCTPPAFKCAVREASSFDRKAQEKATGLAKKIAKGNVAGESNTALLVQAIALAFGMDPDAISKGERARAIWEELRGTVTKGKRAGFGPPVPKDSLAAHDAETADALLAELVARPVRKDGGTGSSDDDSQAPGPKADAKGDENQGGK